MRISQSPRTAGALAVMLLGLGVGCSGSGGAPTVAARVGSEKVSSKKIAALTGRYAHTPQGSDVVEKQGRKELERLILGFQIRLSALNQAAKAVGIAMPESSSNQLLSAMQGNPTYKDFLRQAGYSMEDLETAAKGGWLSKAALPRRSNHRQEPPRPVFRSASGVQAVLEDRGRDSGLPEADFG